MYLWYPHFCLHKLDLTALMEHDVSGTLGECPRKSFFCVHTNVRHLRSAVLKVEQHQGYHLVPPSASHWDFGTLKVLVPQKGQLCFLQAQNPPAAKRGLRGRLSRPPKTWEVDLRKKRNARAPGLVGRCLSGGLTITAICLGYIWMSLPCFFWRDSCCMLL